VKRPRSLNAVQIRRSPFNRSDYFFFFAFSAFIVNRWSETSEGRPPETCLRLAASSSSSSDVISRSSSDVISSTYILYLGANYSPPPRGVLPGNRFLISGVRRATSRRHGTPYFRACVWTGFTLCGRHREGERDEAVAGEESDGGWRPAASQRLMLLGKGGHPWELLSQGCGSALI
jgi:hypothetical protein